MKKTIYLMALAIGLVALSACHDDGSVNPYAHENLYGKWSFEQTLASCAQYDSVFRVSLVIDEDGSFRYDERAVSVLHPDLYRDYDLDQIMYCMTHYGLIEDFSTANVKSGKLSFYMTELWYGYPGQLPSYSVYGFDKVFDLDYDDIIEETALYEWVGDSTITIRILGGAFEPDDVIPVEMKPLLRDFTFEGHKGTQTYTLKKVPTNNRKKK